MYARVAGDGAICSKNRKIVPYHGANPNTRNGARLRSPSLIMAPGSATLPRLDQNSIEDVLAVKCPESFPPGNFSLKRRFQLGQRNMNFPF